MFSVPEVAVILVIVLLIFGPGKLPSLGSALGKGLQNLRKAGEEVGNVSEEARRLGKPEGVKAEGPAARTPTTDQTSAKN